MGPHPWLFIYRVFLQIQLSTFVQLEDVEKALEVEWIMGVIIAGCLKRLPQTYRFQGCILRLLCKPILGG
jgi:hypothetical protein